MIPQPIPNGTPAFFEARLGALTASTVALATVRRGENWGISRARLMVRLVKERLTGRAEYTYCSSAMRWGIAHECDARDAYSDKTGLDVIPGGFLPHPHHSYAGASPDGLIAKGDRVVGIVEIKCPEQKTFDQIAATRCIPPRYRKQIAWQLATTSAGWCDFVVWFPRRTLIVLRMMCEELAALIGTLENQAAEFLAETSLLEAKLRPFIAKGNIS